MTKKSETTVVNVQNLVAILFEIMKADGYAKIRWNHRISNALDAETPIEIMNFSTRTSNAIASVHITNMRDLADRYESLSSLRGFGKKCRAEILNGLLCYHINKNVSAGRKPYDGIELV